MGCLVLTKKVTEIMSSRRTSSLRLGDTPAQKLIQHVKLRLENATTIYKYLDIYLSVFTYTFYLSVPWLSVLDYLICFFIARTKRSAHPILTVFQRMQPCAKAPSEHFLEPSTIHFLLLENFGRCLSYRVTSALELWQCKCKVAQSILQDSDVRRLRGVSFPFTKITVQI